MALQLQCAHAGADEWIGHAVDVGIRRQSDLGSFVVIIAAHFASFHYFSSSLLFPLFFASSACRIHAG